MQKITLTAIKKGKSGTSQHGEWQKYDMTFPVLEIYDQTGTKFTFTRASTFDDCSKIQAGDTVECEAEISGKYLNLKEIKKLSGADVASKSTDISLTTAIASSPKLASSEIGIPIVGRTTRDQSIDEAVAVKAVVEMGGNGLLSLDNPIDARLIKAVKQWCTDKLSHYLAPTPIDASPGVKPVALEGKAEESTDEKVMSQRLLYDMIKSRMGLKGPKANNSVLSWLENVEHIDMARVANEPGKVFTEISEKKGWNGV